MAKNEQSKDSRITVVVAEDNESVRKALVSAIDSSEKLKVVGEACNGRQAVERVLELRPAVLTVDIGMPELNGIEVTKEILGADQETRILAISLNREPEFVRQMMNLGAMGYLLKEDVYDRIVPAIEAIFAGRKYLSPEIQHLNR